MTTESSSEGETKVRNKQRIKPQVSIRVFASLFGAGYSPFASGTVGSALALALYWFIEPLELWWVLASLSVVVFLAGIPASTRMEAYHGDDPSVVVIDEAVGMWLSLMLLPKSIGIAIAAFLVFRIFDIVKPWPANYFDRMHGGFGIMMDDVAAGIYANILIRLLLLIPPVQQLLLW
jgi:phosphatidylglycerophosphatase A